MKSRDPIFSAGRWLAASSIAALLGIGHLNLEVQQDAHRHQMAGRVMAHDHLVLGPHHHHQQPTPVEDFEGEPGPEEDSGTSYLGLLTSHWLNDADLGPVAARPSLSRDPALQAETSSPRSSVPSTISPRAPPALPVFVS